MKNYLLYLLLILPSLCGCALNPLGEEDEAQVVVTSTYLCDEGRTFNAAFDPEGKKASILVEGENHLLYRVRGSKNPVIFTDGNFSLFARNKPSPTIWLEHGGVVVCRKCRQESGKD
jgi:hypothetical protein